MKKRGYTLIELLAVIVVLAIVALIAVPLVLNTIEDVRQASAKASANGYIEAIENKVASSSLSGSQYENKEDYVYDEIAVSVKGTKPTGGIYSLKDGVVTSGVFCINGYEVSYSENQTEINGKCTGEDLKLEGRVKLSATSGYYTYPNNGTFEVIENISGGALSCISDNPSVAECKVSGTTITVIPGKEEGQATITVTAEGNSKYKDASAAYVARTTQGLLSYTANGYNGVYDGEEHGIVVSSENAIIKYGIEEGNYILDASPKYSDVGEYIVYFEITKAGYKTITGNKTVVITKADGRLELEETVGTVEYDKTISVGIKENKSAGEINVVVANPDIVEASMVDGKLSIRAKQTGVTTIRLETAETNNYTSASTEYTVTVTKANNTLTLSASTGSYTYPTSGTFEVTKNASGGALSCTSDNTKVADCSISGTTVIVTPGTTAGSATLTIKSAATTNYNAGQAAYVAVTGSGTMSVTANGYSGVYDGSAHGITVTSSGATIKYGTTAGTYNLTSSPTYTNVGTYTVYYQVTNAGYKTVTGSKTVVITKAAGSVMSPTARTLTYTGSAQALVNAGSSNTGTIQYKLGSTGTYSTNIPTATNAGTYTVYYKVVGDANHNDVAEASISVTINQAILSYTTSGYSGTYDGSAHGIIVTSSGATIKYGTTNGSYTMDASPKYSDVGTYTVYYQITREGYVSVTGSEKIVITKANNTLTLSANTGSYTYPTSGTFIVTKNASGGALSCTSDNTKVADCSISGTIVTVTPGTTAGSATLTIKSAATTNYNAGQAAYVAVTGSGTMSVTANGYSGVYDGSAHGITVTSSGATIKYGTTNGSYTMDASPTYTNVGTYTVYYQVTKAGYKTVTGSKTVVITKAAGSVTSPTARTLTYTGSAQALVNAGSSNTGTIQYKLGSTGTYSTNIPTATNAGTYTVYYKVVGDANHNDVAEASISVTIRKANGSVTAPTAKTLAYTGSVQALVNKGSSSTGTIQYKLGSTGTYSTSIPTATNVGTYTIYYKVVGDANHNDVAEASISVTIGKANNTLTLSANTGNYTYPNSGTFTVTKNASGGTLSCTSDNTSVANCSISGTTVTVTPGTTAGSATLTIKSAATTNYNAGQAAYVAVTAKGTLNNITANGYSGTYDGASHGITVTSSGSTITYATSENGTYSSTNPTYTNAGTYTVYYKVARTGYNTVTGSKTVTITKAANPIAVTASQSWSPTFSTSAQTKTLTAATGSQGTVTYAINSQKNASGTAVSYFTLSGTTVTMKASTPAGTYTVVVRATAAGNSNYNSGYKDITLKVTVGKAANPIAVTASQSWLPTFSTSAQTKTLTAATGSQGTVTYVINSQKNASGTAVSYFTLSGTTVTMRASTPVGTYTVVVRATAAGNSNYNSGYKDITLKVTVGKANNTLKLSANSATYTYPNSGTFTVTSNPSGGALSCATSNSAVATCSISGTTVTVKPGTTAGTANLTITSAATTNYSAGQVVHVATTASGLLSVTANGYSGAYDGSAHGITVTSSGATIKYGTASGTYNLTSSPTYTNAGTYTVYYQVTKTGYKTVTGSKTVTITRAKTATASAANKTYNGSLQTGVSGSYVTWSGTTSATAAGSYTAYATPDSNHAWSDGTTGKKTISWSIHPASGWVNIDHTYRYMYPGFSYITDVDPSGPIEYINSGNTCIASATQEKNSNRVIVTAGSCTGATSIKIGAQALGNYGSAETSFPVTVSSIKPVTAPATAGTQKTITITDNHGVTWTLTCNSIINSGYECEVGKMTTSNAGTVYVPIGSSYYVRSITDGYFYRVSLAYGNGTIADVPNARYIYATTDSESYENFNPSATVNRNTDFEWNGFY